MKSSRQLKYWFAKWNRLYFDNRLPAGTVVFWEPVDGGVAEKDRIYPTSREIVNGVSIIRIDPCLRSHQCLWGMALYHEMCHISKPKAWHGKEFDNEMLRLAQAGAFSHIW